MNIEKYTARLAQDLSTQLKLLTQSYEYRNTPQKTKGRTTVREFCGAFPNLDQLNCGARARYEFVVGQWPVRGPISNAPCTVLENPDDQRLRDCIKVTEETTQVSTCIEDGVLRIMYEPPYSSSRAKPAETVIIPHLSGIIIDTDKRTAPKITEYVPEYWKGLPVIINLISPPEDKNPNAAILPVSTTPLT